ncbi:MAG: serine hydrolase, partial [Bacteroidota bacterium]
MLRIFLLAAFLIPSLSTAQNPLNKVFANDDFLKKLGNNRDKYQIQVVYTQIDRKEDQTPVLTTYEWGTDSSLYYYPASTVKMPAAFLALEKINQLNIVGLDAYSKLEIGAGSEPQTPFSYDSTANDGTASIAQFIKEIFVASDNNAHNRLYEFIGQEQFNRALHRKGFTSTRVVHRLGPG